MRWYVNSNGTTIGPLSEERIAMLCTWGKLSAEAYVCDEQFSNWVPIGRTAFGALVASWDAGEDAAAEEQRDASASTSIRRMGQRLRTYLVGMALIAGAVLLAVFVG